jgi:hypothetical protein
MRHTVCILGGASPAPADHPKDSLLCAGVRRHEEAQTADHRVKDGVPLVNHQFGRVEVDKARGSIVLKTPGGFFLEGGV